MLARLREPGGDGAALLDQLEVWIEMVTTREDAVRIIAELPASCGLDVETAPKPEYRVHRPWLVITKKGERAKHQHQIKDKTALDPHKARIRLIQVYSPEHEAVFLFDLDKLPVEVLDDLGLWANRQLRRPQRRLRGDDAGRPADRADRLHAARRPGARLRVRLAHARQRGRSRCSGSSCRRSSRSATGVPNTCRSPRSTTRLPTP